MEERIRKLLIAKGHPIKSNITKKDTVNAVAEAIKIITKSKACNFNYVGCTCTLQPFLIGRLCGISAECLISMEQQEKNVKVSRS